MRTSSMTPFVKSVRAALHKPDPIMVCPPAVQVAATVALVASSAPFT